MAGERAVAGGAARGAPREGGVIPTDDHRSWIHALLESLEAPVPPGGIDAIEDLAHRRFAVRRIHGVPGRGRGRDELRLDSVTSASLSPPREPGAARAPLALFAE
jgi:hypothetical protein